MAICTTAMTQIMSARNVVSTRIGSITPYQAIPPGVSVHPVSVLAYPAPVWSRDRQRRAASRLRCVTLRAGAGNASRPAHTSACVPEGET